MKNLKKLREKKGLTQNEVATNIGVTVVTYGNWERGKLLPSNNNLKTLSDYFNVTPAYLLGYEDNNNQAPNNPNSFGGDITINQQSDNHVAKLIEYGNKLDRILKNQDETITLLKQIYNELIALKQDTSTNQQKNIDRLLNMLDKTLSE